MTAGCRKHLPLSLPAPAVTLPRHPPLLITEEETLPWLLPPCPRAQHGAQGDFAPCLVSPEPGEQQSQAQPLLHHSSPGHAELCSRATSGPWELVFLYNTSQDLRA